jgi:hypothetical protein
MKEGGGASVGKIEVFDDKTKSLEAPIGNFLLDEVLSVYHTYIAIK